MQFPTQYYTNATEIVKIFGGNAVEVHTANWLRWPIVSPSTCFSSESFIVFFARPLANAIHLHHQPNSIFRESCRHASESGWMFVAQITPIYGTYQKWIRSVPIYRFMHTRYSLLPLNRKLLSFHVDTRTGSIYEVVDENKYLSLLM